MKQKIDQQYNNQNHTDEELNSDDSEDQKYHTNKNRDIIKTSAVKVNILNGYGRDDHKFTRNMMHYKFSLILYEAPSIYLQFMEAEDVLDNFL